MRKRTAGFISRHSIACIALFFAFTAPASALVVTGALVTDESLTGADIRNDSLTGADVAELTLDNPLWAIVEADGTLAAAGQPGTSVEKLNSGIYSVRFPKSVEQCAATATLFSEGGPHVWTQMGTITTIAAHPSLPNDLGVVTVGDSGGGADRRFSVMVAC